MNVNSIGALMNTTSNASTQTTGKPSERDMFMTLLVTQLKHQDPLEPQDGTQFVAQLAQFNSLDQLIGIKDSIDRLITLSQGSTPTDTTA